MPEAPEITDGILEAEPLDRESLRAVELQRRLVETTSTAGWQDVLDIAEKLVEKAETDLIAYTGTDREQLAQLHAKAVAARTFFHTFQTAIVVAVEGATKTPRRLEAIDFQRNSA